MAHTDGREWQTHKHTPTRKQTNKQTLLKTSNALRYLTTLGNNRKWNCDGFSIHTPVWRHFCTSWWHARRRVVRPACILSFSVNARTVRSTQRLDVVRRTTVGIAVNIHKPREFTRQCCYDLQLQFVLIHRHCLWHSSLDNKTPCAGSGAVRIPPTPFPGRRSWLPNQDVVCSVS